MILNKGKEINVKTSTMELIVKLIELTRDEKITWISNCPKFKNVWVLKLNNIIIYLYYGYGLNFEVCEYDENIIKQGNELKPFIYVNASLEEVKNTYYFGKLNELYYLIQEKIIHGSSRVIHEIINELEGK